MIITRPSLIIFDSAIYKIGYHPESFNRTAWFYWYKNGMTPANKRK
jgi:hypothetical protein